jgi:hypothetical protein
MDPLHYRLVFSVADAGYKSWTFPAFGLIFIFAGIFVIPTLSRFSRRSYPPAVMAIFQVFFVGIALLFTILAFVGTFGEYRDARSALTNGTAQYIEGTVENFVPKPVTGHAMESFDVNSVPFRYSDNVIIAGFNQTSSHGGPIREGLPVHIWYRPFGSGRNAYNEILKLEVAEK